MEAIAAAVLQPRDHARRSLPLMLRGFGTTLYLCLLVIPLGLAGGLAVRRCFRARGAGCAGRRSPLVDFFRAIPPLVLLICIYSGLPFAGIRPSPARRGRLAFLLNTSSYYGEIYRAGIESIGAGPVGSGALDRPFAGADTAHVSCRRRCATSCPISSPIRSRWSSSPRSPALSPSRSCSIRRTWRAR